MKKYIKEVSVTDLLSYLLLPSVALALTVLSTVMLHGRLSGAIRVIHLVAAILLLYFETERLVIGLVLVYKMLAPHSVHRRCRFEPTCSTYMILAIKKYGLLIGLFKGIRRLMRCKEPNGGIDPP